MQTLLKAAISLAIIFVATGVGKKLPSLAGLIAVMPLTGALVMIWLYIENNGNPEIMQEYARGAIWGILPSILFFILGWICFRKHLSLVLVLPICFAVWLMGAFFHQLFLK
jgi:hypothetical protein